MANFVNFVNMNFKLLISFLFRLLIINLINNLALLQYNLVYKTIKKKGNCLVYLIFDPKNNIWIF